MPLRAPRSGGRVVPIAAIELARSIHPLRARGSVFCPVCGDEYRSGYVACADCDVALVEQPPSERQPKPFDLVTVLETGSQSLIVVVRSILDSAGIPYVARNERLQDLFGWGRIGAGFNVAMGPVRFQVPRDREEEARALLTEVPVIENGLG